MTEAGSRGIVPGAVEGAPSSLSQFFLPLLLVLTAIRLWVAARLPLSPDEAYYWVWSRALAPGYLDHPPMVALFIRLGVFLAGPSALGVRLLAPVSALLGSIFLARATEALLPDAGARVALLFNATLLMAAGAVTMTPDTPLLLFWTAAFWALARFAASGLGYWWLLAGIFGGLALASKYTAFLLFLGAGAWLLAVPSLRPWLRRWPVWGGAGLSAALFVPTFAWNAEHGWASFLKQGGRSAAFHPGFRYLGELIAGQAGLATPLIFLLAVAGVWLAGRQFWQTREAGRGLLLALAVVPGLVFVEHALGDRVQANWPAVCYPAALAAVAALGGGGRRLMVPAAVLGFVLGAIVYWQAIAAPLPLPRQFDPTLARLAGWRAWAEEIEAAREASGALYVADENYGEAAMLAWLLPRGVVVVGLAPRWTLFRLPPLSPALVGAPGLLVETARRAPRLNGDGVAVTPLAEISRARGGVTAERYRLYHLQLGDGAPAAVILPRPEEDRGEGQGEGQEKEM